jgi:hypothetical protein
VSSAKIGSLSGFGLILLAALGTRPACAETWPPEPTAAYPSLEAARDSIGAIVDRCVSPADTAIHVSRDPVSFEYLYAKATAKGWAFHVLVNDTTACPDVDIERSLTDAGWVESFGYSADGSDGSSMGYLSRGYFCLVEGTWDGGDDTDDTYEPLPGCKVTVTCVPRREDDTPRQ